MKSKGLWTISPFLFFLLFYIGSSLFSGDFRNTPLVVAFLFSSIFALVITPKLNIKEKVNLYCKGVADESLIFMFLIFLLAGAFSSSAQAMGCIDNTVTCILSICPAKYILAGIFLAGCFLSFGTGSGIGTIVAIGPLAAGISEQTGINGALSMAAVVCGAMFGDNLSFISDTTVIATQSQGCSLKDKFKINAYIAIPAAIVATVLFMLEGETSKYVQLHESYDMLKVLPYIMIIICSLCGVDVLVTLFLGTLLCGVMGIVMGDYDFFGWMKAVAGGIDGMSVFVVIIMLAMGLLAVMKYNGGIEYITRICTSFVRGKKSAEICVFILTSLICVCTANNTVSIISSGPIVKDLSVKYGINPKRACSLLDISSCIVQETLPYSTHLLVAAAFASVSTFDMLPYVFYPYVLLVFTLISILTGIPSGNRK